MWSESEKMRRPVLEGSILFLTGILVARLLGMWTALWLVLAGASFFAVLVLCLAKKRIPLKKDKGISLFLAISLLFLGAFWFSLSRYPERFAEASAGLTVQGEGVIISYPQENEWGVSCLVRVEKISAGKKHLANRQKVLLKFKSDEAGPSYFPGDRVKFVGEIVLPPEARNPGGFNYREYLAQQEIFQIVNCHQGEVEVSDNGRGLQALAARGRKQVVRHLNRILPQRERGLLLGVLFGDTKVMAEEEWEAYQRAGVVHLFAVSGLHVGIVLGLIWFLLSFCKSNPLLRLSLGAVVLTGYGFMVGWSASILRASSMALLGLLALAVDRKNDLYNSLGAAAWIVLILYPGELFQVGFQLSFLTTLGIIYLTPWLEKKGCGKLLAVPLAASMASMPILAYHFNQISLIAPLVNIIAVAVTSFAAVLSFLAAFLTWVWPCLSTPFFWAAGFIMFILSELVIWCAELKWAGINIATPAPQVIICLYLFMAVLPFLAYSRYLIRGIPVKIKSVAASLLVLTVVFACWPVSRKMEVIFLDVGQGDSILIRTPKGKTALIDGGGTPGSDFPVGKKVVRPVLAHYGINKIELMMMSHRDLDHSEGLLEIMPYFQVGVFFQPPCEENNEMEKRIAELCAQKKIVRQELTAGQGVHLEQDVFLEVLHPAPEDAFTGNNRSLVVKVKYKGCTWLLTGDVEKEAIEQLLARGVDLRADILKIPHHGSVGSLVPLFYEKVKPQAVVISVGENRFNQPHPEIEAYFTEMEVPVYITRNKGAVITKSNGQKIIISTFL
ncbi:MAG: DNA internalization-related competence protein ComEC/Rec2 [Clostridia bacterium]|nr:DNA internalization-related competence protein ComEC/Rec2 [Clostridia bacterium]